MESAGCSGRGDRCKGKNMNNSEEIPTNISPNTLTCPKCGGLLKVDHDAILGIYILGCSCGWQRTMFTGVEQGGKDDK
jgi:hypothetical protein